MGAWTPARCIHGVVDRRDLRGAAPCQRPDCPHSAARPSPPTLQPAPPMPSALECGTQLSDDNSCHGGETGDGRGCSLRRRLCLLLLLLLLLLPPLLLSSFVLSSVLSNQQSAERGKTSCTETHLGIQRWAAIAAHALAARRANPFLCPADLTKGSASPAAACLILVCSSTSQSASDVSLSIDW